MRRSKDEVHVKSHALWFNSQMVRWGHTPDRAAAAHRPYRPDLWRNALDPPDACLAEDQA